MLTIHFLDGVGEEGRAWLEEMLEGDRAEPMHRAFRDARTVVGTAVWEPSETVRDVLVQNRLGWLPVKSTNDELARILLVIQAARLSADPAGLVGEWFVAGDVDERRSILRSLSLLPRPKRYVSIASSALDDAELRVFEAISCDNPFGATYFSDQQFERMLDRVVSDGLSPARVLNATERGIETSPRIATAALRRRVTRVREAYDAAMDSIAEAQPVSRPSGRNGSPGT